MPKDPYDGSKPTRPKQPAQSAEPRTDEGEQTMQACPLCLRLGYVKPEHAIAFEAFCARLHAEQEE